MTSEGEIFGGGNAAAAPPGFQSQATYTPSIRVYCAEADVDYVLSSFGVQTRTDDDELGQVNEANLMQGIEKAAVDMNDALLPIYAASVIAQSPWAKWCNAVLAAVEISLRRGNDAPKSLADAAEKYRQRLQQINRMEAPLLLATGMAPTAQDQLPVVTNYTVDMRFPRTKIRRIPSTSSDQTPANGIKQYDALDFYQFP